MAILMAAPLGSAELGAAEMKWRSASSGKVQASHAVAQRGAVRPAESVKLAAWQPESQSVVVHRSVERSDGAAGFDPFEEEAKAPERPVAEVAMAPVDDAPPAFDPFDEDDAREELGTSAADLVHDESASEGEDNAAADIGGDALWSDPSEARGGDGFAAGESEVTSELGDVAIPEAEPASENAFVEEPADAIDEPALEAPEQGSELGIVDAEEMADELEQPVNEEVVLEAPEEAAEELPNQREEFNEELGSDELDRLLGTPGEDEPSMQFGGQPQRLPALTPEQEEARRRALEEEQRRAAADCREIYEAVKQDTIDTISLDINVRGNPGEDFPIDCGLGQERFQPRAWPQITYLWKAAGLCHKPLYFEQTQLERHGHDWGPVLQPVMSGAHFFGTLPILPYKMGLETPNECVYTLGHYRPGSCAPYMIPALGFTWRAAAFEAAAWTGGVFAIP